MTWKDLDEISVAWTASEGATSYELVFVGTNGDQELREVQTEDGLLQVEWSGLPNLGAPEMVKVRALGENGLTSERFAETPVPDQLSPPTAIEISWRSASELSVKWDPVVGASKYEIRLHRSDGAPEVFEVFREDWMGSPRQPLPSAVSIYALASTERRSVPSPHVTVPKKAVATSESADELEDSTTDLAPKNKDGIETVHGPQNLDGNKTIHEPNEVDDDTTIRVPKKKPGNEPHERTESEEERHIPVRAPLEPTGGKNLVSPQLLQRQPFNFNTQIK